MTWEVVIGLETHAQLATDSKIFSGASTRFGALPNSQACAVDLGLPGVLPVLNRRAVECAIRFGLAVGAQVMPESIFARKNYFYPDLPKGYQISQYEQPVVVGGGLRIHTSQGEKWVPLTRAHLEEDAGKSLHEDFQGQSGIDLNRAGTPLLEIVTEPAMRSAEEAVAYARTLHALVRWIEICDGNMQEGSFRCDANVSVRPLGSAAYGTRCEIKNLNSFRFLERAIEHEVRRQIALIEDGGRVVQETRLYDPERDETRAMRSKEDAMDYRYFPDPDLPPLRISADWVEQVAQSLPELPQQRLQRYTTQLGLGDYDAGLLTGSRELGDYFEAVCVAAPAVDAKLCANWVNGELAAALNRHGLEIRAARISATQLGALLLRLSDGTLSGKTAKQLFDHLWEGGGEVDALIQQHSLRQISDGAALHVMLESLLAEHPAQVAEYRAGKDKVFGFFVGKAMKASAGKANPTQLNALLKKLLAS